MKYIEKLKTVSHNLEKCERVTKHSTNEENQADTLAHALIDIEESLNQVINVYIPKLYSVDLDGDLVEDIILDIGEDLRHILYHIKDSKVYDYLGVSD